MSADAIGALLQWILVGIYLTAIGYIIVAINNALDKWSPVIMAIVSGCCQ